MNKEQELKVMGMSIAAGVIGLGSSLLARPEGAASIAHAGEQPKKTPVTRTVEWRNVNPDTGRVATVTNMNPGDYLVIAASKTEIDGKIYDTKDVNKVYVWVIGAQGKVNSVPYATYPYNERTVRSNSEAADETKRRADFTKAGMDEVQAALVPGLDCFTGCNTVFGGVLEVREANGKAQFTLVSGPQSTTRY